MTVWSRERSSRTKPKLPWIPPPAPWASRSAGPVPCTRTSKRGSGSAYSFVMSIKVNSDTYVRVKLDLCEARHMLMKEMVQRTGVHERLLRYYEQQGLLTPERLPSGYRVYRDADLETVRRIRYLLAAGLTTTLIG